MTDKKLEQMILRDFSLVSLRQERVRLNVTWYNEKIGTILVSDDEVCWEGYANEDMKALFGDLLPTRDTDGMPQFLVNLVPDNEVFDHLGIDDQASYMKTGLRFSSNIVISPNAPYDKPVENRYHHAYFEDYVDQEGVFIGEYLGKPPATIEEEALSKEFSKLWTNPYVPRYSGAEMKLPVTLQHAGMLQKAITTPFTHFIKFPTEGYKEGWGVNEWMCMQLAEATGLPTAKHALIEISEDLPPAYIVERFDINDESKQGSVRRLMHDFCTLAGMRPFKGVQDTREEGITAGSLNKVAKTLKEYSTDPSQDLEDLFKRALVSIAVGDGDMHRKNISMIFRYDEINKKLLSANMSPAYDITSEIYEDAQTVLPLNGKGNNFNRRHLVNFAKTIGIDPVRADEIITDTFTSIARRAVEISHNLPDIATKNRICVHTAHRITTIAVANARAMDCEVPEWEPIKANKVRYSELEDMKFIPDAGTFQIATFD